MGVLRKSIALPDGRTLDVDQGADDVVFKLDGEDATRQEAERAWEEQGWSYHRGAALRHVLESWGMRIRS